MTQAQKLQAVQDWIVRACPEIFKHGVCPCCAYENCYLGRRTNIGIAEALRAMQGRENSPIGVSINGDFLDCDDHMNNTHEIGATWNLADDNLYHQKPPVIDFLYSLLP